ncbi:phosphate ABC transporter, permease protein PstA [Erysipelotrichaceae bacterium]|nr:phosphate ABC transporter, permease protein PstA [Erysipelotrichaceae bacterium]
MKVEYDKNRIAKRNFKSNMFATFVLSVIILCFATLIWLITSIVIDAAGWIDWQFIMSFPSRFPEKSGVLPGLVGSLILTISISVIAVPIGVGSAIYLEEYANRKGLFYKIIDISISNLSGVPSIIYGILGLSLFSLITILKGTILAGAITLSLLILPVVIVSSQEALKAVPRSLKEAAYGLGMSKWQMIVAVVIPYALPGMLTGVILALSRAIGEGAPLIVIGAATFVNKLPSSLTSSFTALPIQVFYWSSLPKAEFQNVAAAGSIVLIAVLLLFNSIAIILRNKYQRRQ